MRRKLVGVFFLGVALATGSCGTNDDPSESDESDGTAGWANGIGGAAVGVGGTAVGVAVSCRILSRLRRPNYCDT